MNEDQKKWLAATQAAINLHKAAEEQGSQTPDTQPTATDEIGRLEAPADAGGLPGEAQDPYSWEVDKDTLVFSSAAEAAWFAGLPPEVQRVIRAHGLSLFHYCMNLMHLTAEIGEMRERIKARDSQDRLTRITVSINQISKLARAGNGWTVEQLRACQQDIQFLSAFQPEAPRIIRPH
jgi:hypothetical protein